MNYLKLFNYYLFSSRNTTIFYCNFFMWLLLKLTLSIYYGINLNSVLLGYFCWPFWEYSYHRYIMHGLKNTIYYYKLHGYHHLHPSKISHIPVFQYFLVSPVFVIMSFYINPSYIYSYSTGHLCGLFCFEMMHYFIHKDTQKEKIYSKYHLYHHKFSNTSFCFTAPCLDIICGTFPDCFTYNLLGILPVPYFSFYGIKEKKLF